LLVSAAWNAWQREEGTVVQQRRMRKAGRHTNRNISYLLVSFAVSRVRKEKVQEGDEDQGVR